MKRKQPNTITTDFVIRQYQSGIKSYRDFTVEVGLWESEKEVFATHLQPDDKILDIGCGTGRTTFGLFQMGRRNIIGIDLTPEMIDEARKLNAHFSTNIDFRIGDATSLQFEEETLDAVLFSFNGVMSIPRQDRRQKAFEEINRVLKRNGIFVFTTHDRGRDENYLEFWKEEEKRWKEGQQHKGLFEFGDLITRSKNEEREIYIHIPSRAEIETIIDKCGFELLDTFYRMERFDEPQAVKVKSGECRFWIVRKC